MKHKVLYIMLTMVALAFTACETKDVIPIGGPQIKRQTAQVSVDGMDLDGSFSSVVTIKEVAVAVSENSDLSNATTTQLNLYDTLFYGFVSGLHTYTDYYYQYIFTSKYNNVKYTSEIYTAKTYKPVVDFRDISFSNLTATSVTVNGSITLYGDNTYISERGLLYSTNADLSNATQIRGAAGTDAFSMDISELTPNTTYYVGVYAVVNKGAYHETELSQIFSFSTPLAPQVGALSGLFSIGQTQQVYFSQGNLQYQASTNTWRFAMRQWDMVGMGYGVTDEIKMCYIGGTVPNSDNRKISDTYNGWIDLFGGGTGDYPTNASNNDADYPVFVDWGTNAISNGGNQPNQWRSLTDIECYNLLYGRGGDKWGVACVNGINGLILLPDVWNLPDGLTFNAGFASDNGSECYKTINYYTLDQWDKMEAAGAVFLPAAGRRSTNKDVQFVGHDGEYRGKETGIFFNSTRWESSYSHYSDFYGYSVRLVQDAQ